MCRPFRFASVTLLVSTALAAAPVAFAQEPLPARKAVPLTAVEEAAFKAGDSFKECQECPEMVVVPSGSFMMGSSQAEIEHLITESIQKRWLEEKYAVGTTTAFSTGPTITRSQALFRNLGGPVEVGTFPPNAFGLHDLHGNAGEIVQDCWHANYVGAQTDGSAWTDGNCHIRVVRGGTAHLPPLFHRSAASAGIGRDYPDVLGHYGFGVARALTRD